MTSCIMTIRDVNLLKIGKKQSQTTVLVHYFVPFMNEGGPPNSTKSQKKSHVHAV